MTAPFTHPINLARLGTAGDDVHFEAGEGELAAIAAMAGALALSRFAAGVMLKRISSSRFQLDYRVEADVSQACVVTLEPVASRIELAFTRELHFAGTGRHKPEPVVEVAEIDLSQQDGPEEIDSLHFDLAAPALEEFLLALDPYPRCPGAELAPEAGANLPVQGPFEVLKALKSSK